jgi:polyferredoxin
MLNGKVFDQWKSYLSLKTPVLIAFLMIWNLGILIGMYDFKSELNSVINTGSAVVISATCLCASFFGFSVAISEKLRNKLIEPKRAHNYSRKHFYLLGFVALVLAVGVLFFANLQHV